LARGVVESERRGEHVPTAATAPRRRPPQWDTTPAPVLASVLLCEGELAMTQIPATDAPSVPRPRHYDVVALQVPIAYNRHGDHDHSGLIFALERNYTALKALDFRPDQPHPLVRPLVLRACAGETVEVTLTNHLKNRRVGLHLVGEGYDVAGNDGAQVGGNQDSTVPKCPDNGPAPQRTYRWHCVHEGVSSCTTPPISVARRTAATCTGCSGCSSSSRRGPSGGTPPIPMGQRLRMGGRSTASTLT